MFFPAAVAGAGAAVDDSPFLHFHFPSFFGLTRGSLPFLPFLRPQRYFKLVDFFFD